MSLGIAFEGLGFRVDGEWGLKVVIKRCGLECSVYKYRDSGNWECSISCGWGSSLVRVWVPYYMLKIWVLRTTPVLERPSPNLKA